MNKLIGRIMAIVILLTIALTAANSFLSWFK